MLRILLPLQLPMTASATACRWPMSFRGSVNTQMSKAQHLAAASVDDMRACAFNDHDFEVDAPHIASSASTSSTPLNFSNIAPVSRRKLLLRSTLWVAALSYGSGTISYASAYTVDQVKPNEQETYALAQKGNGPLRILWLGAGNMKGVFNDLFQPGTSNEVVALDLLRPDATDLRAATAHATRQGYRMRFEQGDATNLKFTDGSFDTVVCSLFLCQDFDPVVVVSEIRRVLKPGGRFGFYEHVEDIDKVVVGKVFGERSVIRVQAKPEKLNIMAGVVRKV